jgi:hypothetical protein
MTMEHSEGRIILKNNLSEKIFNLQRSRAR